jgi:iron(III) transport system permease protein
VAWNTLLLALMTAASTTVLGTLMALMAERGSRRLSRPLGMVALLPIITPPFVVGLGLILLFGRAGLVNQFLEWAFGIAPSRWFYGWVGIWMAQTFAFTPIAFMIMRSWCRAWRPAWKRRANPARQPAQTFAPSRCRCSSRGWPTPS